MSYRLPPLSALRAFESAARHLSFKRAAAELFVTPAAVSQQIKTLEAYLDTPLFRRRPRALELTNAGIAMLPKVSEGLANLVAAVETTRHGGPRALTVHVPPFFALRWLVPRLPRFAVLHPDIELRLTSSEASIDGVGEPVEVLADLHGDVTDVMVRFGAGRYTGSQCDLILAPDYMLVCSPELIARSGLLLTPADVCRQVLIHDESLPDEGGRPNWADWFRLAGLPGADVSRGPRFSSTALVLEAVLGGQGVALILRPLIEAEVAAGRLILPFDVSMPSRYAYHLVISDSVRERPEVGAFREWMLTEVVKSDGR
ncbi:MAG: transcriptional regulator GcvA [Proteobacteria bacterium]|nr:transcriptional regulator GcvA [Pseudomonadota bacterium]